MIEFEPLGIAEQRLEVRRGIIALRSESHQMLVARPVGQLDQAQSVAPGDQAHRFGIDRDDRPGGENIGRGKIFFVEVDGHDSAGFLGRLSMVRRA